MNKYMSHLKIKFLKYIFKNYVNLIFVKFYVVFLIIKAIFSFPLLNIHVINHSTSKKGQLKILI